MKNTGAFLGGIILGAVLGGAAALLYAPQTGEDTRKQIKTKVDELEEELEKMQAKLKDKGVELKEDVKVKIKDLEARIEKLMEQYRKAPAEKVAAK